MSVVHHFAYGIVTPILSYALSVLGSLLGLTCTKRVRQASTAGSKVGWLLLAAWALGGTAIWTMHFMAMLGFAVEGSPIRYQVGTTILSAVIAVVVVGAGLLFVGLGRPRPIKILIGGLFTGIGVAAMHYTGMAAVRVDGEIHHDQSLVIASVIIAVVASTVALWFTVIVSKPILIFASALLMGVAVCGMHYTAMAAVSVSAGTPTFGLTGATASTLLLPIIVLVVLVVVALFYALLSGGGDEDAKARDYAVRLQTGQIAHEQIAKQRTERRPYTPAARR